MTSMDMNEVKKLFGISAEFDDIIDRFILIESEVTKSEAEILEDVDKLLEAEKEKTRKVLGDMYGSLEDIISRSKNTESEPEDVIIGGPMSMVD